MNKMEEKAFQNLCSATTTKGFPCRNHVMKGASYCYIHSLGRMQHIPVWKNATVHGLLGAIIIAIISYQLTANRSTQTAMFKQIEENASLLDDIWISQHKSELLKKYPGGYVVFGIDPNSANQLRSEKRLIPRKGHVLDEYTFKWDRVTISVLTADSVTIDLPDIIYIPLNTHVYGCAIGLNRRNPGQPRILPLRPVGTKNRIFVELVYDKPSLLAFAIGFKPE